MPWESGYRSCVRRDRTLTHAGFPLPGDCLPGVEVSPFLLPIGSGRMCRRRGSLPSSGQANGYASLDVHHPADRAIGRDLHRGHSGGKSNRLLAPDNTDQHHDDRHNEQDVNESVQRGSRRQSQRPKHQEHNEDCPEHGVFFLKKGVTYQGSVSEPF